MLKVLCTSVPVVDGAICNTSHMLVVFTAERARRYDGQEACMVGIGAATTDKDSIITSYRDHCTHLVKGGSLLEVRLIPPPQHRSSVLHPAQ